MTAAMLLALVALGVIFSEKHYATGIGEQLAIRLPDGSSVQLNAASRLKHRRFFWDHDKTLTLVEGEGFFEVEHVGQFRVNTPHGAVRVLGTSFNIRSRNKLFELACYEGSVQFAEKTLLSAGEVLHRENGQFVKEHLLEPAPSWISGIGIFRNVPLAVVLQELQLQYGLKVEAGEVDTSARFSGSFVHNDLPTALKSVLLPMGISYEQQPGQKSIKLLPNSSVPTSFRGIGCWPATSFQGPMSFSGCSEVKPWKTRKTARRGITTSCDRGAMPPIPSIRNTAGARREPGC